MSVVTVRFRQSAMIEATHGDCPNCQSDLQIHQPDPGLPDRLLAVCEECHHWYLQTADDMLIPLVSSEAELASE